MTTNLRINVHFCSMKSILIIGYVWVEPNSSAAGSRMLQLIELFLKQGYKITFTSPAQKGQKAMDLSAINVEETAIELNSSSFDSFVKNLQPNIVLFDRFMMEEQFGWRIAENCPNAIRILDTEDLHSLRKVRHEKLKKNEVFQTEDLLTSDIAKREIASILRCDLSLIISSFEMELLQKTFKISNDLLLHLPFLLDKIEEKQIDNWLPFEDREHFVFVGNFLHAPNVNAVLELKKLWENIKKQLLKAELHIYGAYATQQINELHNKEDRFIIKGFTEDIKSIVRKAKVVIAPLQFGAGIKGKLTEAMTCGTPSITTKIGAEGMHDNLNWNGIIEDDFKNFTQKAIELYSNKELWQQSQQNGVKIINQLYNKEVLENKFVNKIERIEKNFSEHRTQNFFGSMLQHQTLNASKYMSKWIELKNAKL